MEKKTIPWSNNYIFFIILNLGKKKRYYYIFFFLQYNDSIYLSLSLSYLGQMWQLFINYFI